ncbi:winged helix-turn-helix domain-containing protein [Amycolatopsis thermophila]|uniref:Winged helix-turn-helix transcriptional regulator n=1 Tax=Amycolatopsis thermophila TaxID=206084 RepID=A0ABU0EZD8_9PSEU|nr:winged helix-turn-helix domain-containing protein [Amycolatopsis thermophila]MDQ0380636.1 hypothetical protein [Amycolatopsis thermophila]
MLFDRRAIEGLADGSVTVAFRRWDAPRVRPGSRMRTAAGVVEVTSVEEVGSVTDEDARAAGAASAAEVAGRGTGRLYRIGLRVVGPDPRVALRSSADLSDDDRAGIGAALWRLDRVAEVPWTGALLRLIAENEAVRAADLADRVGLPRDVFKRRVRRLKELGLTESLDIGYRISPRGRAFLAGG